MQELLPTDIPAREDFVLEFLVRMEVDNKWLWKLLWTDGAHFHLKACVNTQNNRILATEDPLAN